MEHVKTSEPITHVLALLDFKVSTVKQVKKLRDSKASTECNFEVGEN